MKYACFLFLSCILLIFSCDAPPKMERVNQGNLTTSKKEADATVKAIIANPEDLIKAYFSALKIRDHQQMKSYLKYPEIKFYLDELSPITDWEIIEIAELTSAEADTFKLKPNPIKGDYLLRVKQYTVDDYKKTSYLVEYIIREEKRVYQLINRLEHPKVQTLFINLTRDGITNLEELQVLAERPNSYLLKAEPHFWISINAKAMILDQLQAEKGSEFELKGNEIMLGDSLYATWGRDQQFDIANTEEVIE
jgi:hypothetical protein